MYEFVYEENKIYFRLTMTQNRCSDLTVISIEEELSNQIVNKDIL